MAVVLPLSRVDDDAAGRSRTLLVAVAVTLVVVAPVVALVR